MAFSCQRMIPPDSPKNILDNDEDANKHHTAIHQNLMPISIIFVAE